MAGSKRAGKRKLFEEALREAHNFAWDGRWEPAIQAYQRALAEFPDDVTVRSNLAQAYFITNQLDQALVEYRAVSALKPEDPLPLRQIADALVKQRKIDEAVECYLSAAARHEDADEGAQAVELLETAVKLAPDHLPARDRLATLYMVAGKRNAALEQYLAQARIHQASGRNEQASQCIQRALQINPRSAEARQALGAVAAGGSATVATTKQAALPPELREKMAGASPVEAARQHALTELAEIVFEQAPPGNESSWSNLTERFPRLSDPVVRSRVNALIGQAIHHQTGGMLEDAIVAYTDALELGTDLPAIHFNLGLLYQKNSRLDDMVRHLEIAVQADDFALGGHFALGESYRAEGNIEQAVRHFGEVLRIIEVQRVRLEDAPALMQLYDDLPQSSLARGSRERVLVFLSSVADFLTSQDWEERVSEAHRRLQDLNQGGFLTSLAELLAVANPNAALRSLGLSQDYLQQSMYLSAAEECYQAISQTPGYLPLHVRLAEILFAEGRAEEALAKYLKVADTYLTRRQSRQAIGMYRRILALAPTDVVVRGRLIDHLVTLGQIDEALQEHLALADTYYHMAQSGKAIEAYNQALRLVPRSSDKAQWEIRILYPLADIYRQSVDWSKAKNAYQRILALRPADREARLASIDLAFKLGDGQAASRGLDELAQSHQSGEMADSVLASLRDMAQAHPKELSLHARLAQAYLQQNRTEEAIAELNVLGELQLDAGLYQEAAATVRQLASLEPDPQKAGDYRSLLQQILSAHAEGE